MQFYRVLFVIVLSGYITCMQQDVPEQFCYLALLPYEIQNHIASYLSSKSYETEYEFKKRLLEHLQGCPSISLFDFYERKLEITSKGSLKIKYQLPNGLNTIEYIVCSEFERGTFYFPSDKELDTCVTRFSLSSNRKTLVCLHDKKIMVFELDKNTEKLQPQSTYSLEEYENLSKLIRLLAVTRNGGYIAFADHHNIFLAKANAVGYKCLYAADKRFYPINEKRLKYAFGALAFNAQETILGFRCTLYHQAVLEQEDKTHLIHLSPERWTLADYFKENTICNKTEWYQQCAWWRKQRN